MHVKPILNYNDLVNGYGGLPQVEDKCDKLYIEFNVDKLYPGQRDENFQGFPAANSPFGPGYLIFHHYSNKIGWYSQGDIGLCYASGSSYRYITASPAYKVAGRYGYGFDFDGNILNFFLNGSLFFKINLNGYANLKDYKFCNTMYKQAIFKDEFGSIPSGYQTLSDLMPDVALKDLEQRLHSYM